jgi:hypothetical protein
MHANRSRIKYCLYHAKIKITGHIGIHYAYGMDIIIVKVNCK